jgi:hypothetical protein
MVKTNKEKDALTFESALGQLRHAYQHLVSPEPATWTVEQRKRFADGLIAPQIAVLELLYIDFERMGEDLATALTATARQRKRMKAIEETLLAKAHDIGSASQARRIIFSVFHEKGAT